MSDKIDVVVFLNESGETSIPLEIVSKTEDNDISIDVYSFFEPDENTLGCEVQSLNADSQVDINAYRRLYSILREEKPDVFHVHPNATGSIARVVAKIAGVPHIVSTEHSVHTEFGYLKNAVNGSTNWINEVVVCNSGVTSDSFSKWEEFLIRFTHTEKTVIYNGVDLDRLNTGNNSYTDLPEGYLIGTVGRLVPEKNQASIINAIGHLVEDKSDIQAVIVGDGQLRKELKELAEDKGVSNHIHFTGHVSRDEVYSILKSLDVFVFPSFYEGFGVAVVEAMTTGTPVIVNDIPVLREVVGDAGVFVDATDPEEVASAMKELYDNKEKRRILGEEAEDRAKNKFSLEKTVESYTSLYRSLVNR